MDHKRGLQRDTADALIQVLIFPKKFDPSAVFDRTGGVAEEKDKAMESYDQDLGSGWFRHRPTTVMPQPDHSKTHHRRVRPVAKLSTSVAAHRSCEISASVRK